MAKLELKGLKKKYPDFTLELDLEVKEGEFLTIIGPSGSGKSRMRDRFLLTGKTL